MNEPESSGLPVKRPAPRSAYETLREQSYPESSTWPCPPPYLYGLPTILLAALIAPTTSGGASAGGIAFPATILALPAGRNSGSSGDTPPVRAPLDWVEAPPLEELEAARALAGRSAKAAASMAAASSIVRRLEDISFVRLRG